MYTYFFIKISNGIKVCAQDVGVRTWSDDDTQIFIKERFTHQIYDELKEIVSETKSNL